MSTALLTEVLTAEELAATAPGLTSDDMWSMYVKGLAQASGLTPGVLQNLMLAGISQPAQLNTETTTVGKIPVEQALWQIFQSGDSLPEWAATQQGDVGLFYVRSVVQLANQYASFVRSIQLEGDPDPATRAVLNKYQGELAQAVDFWTTEYDNAFTVYLRMSAQFKDYEDFLKKTPYGKRVDAAFSTVTAKQIQYDQAMRRAYGSQFDQLAQGLDLITQLQKELSNGSGTLIMQVKNDSGTFPVPRYSPSALGQAGGTGYSAWLDQAIEAAAKKVPPEVNVTLRQGAASYDMSALKFSFQSKVRYLPYFWMTTETGYQQINVDTASSGFSINISLQSVTQVSLTPGQWLQGDLLRNYNEPDDFLPDSPFAKKPIWGPNGLLNVIPTGLVIGYRPTVKVTFDSTSYSSFRRDWQNRTTLAIGVGPFYIGIGAGASGSKESAQFNDSESSFSFTDQTLVPKILGFIVSTPNFPQVGP